jgi:protein involved in polysaccharide export with SLBB domain
MKAHEERKTWLPGSPLGSSCRRARTGGLRGLGKAGLFACAGFLLIQSAGCTSQRPWVDRAIMAQPTPPAILDSTAAEYLVSCSDLLEIKVSGRPDLSSTQEIAGDGKVNAGNGERVRVEGLTTAAVSRRLAGVSRLGFDQVTVRVAEYHSQQIYLLGQAVGLQRSVPYQGPERVLELLQRVGGVTAGAAPDEVYVVRSRIAEGKQPEVYHVRLREILTKHDESTNIRLQPQDQIYVGETNRSALSRYLPPWLKPLFDSFWGMARPEKPAPAAS